MVTVHADIACIGGAADARMADDCPEFVQYTGQNIESCYRSGIQVFQDGYRICSSMVNGSCEKCLREMAEVIERRNKDE